MKGSQRRGRGKRRYRDGILFVVASRGKEHRVTRRAFNHGKKKQASCLGERKTQLKVYSVMSGRSWKRGERKGRDGHEFRQREKESKNKRLE